MELGSSTRRVIGITAIAALVVAACAGPDEVAFETGQATAQIATATDDTGLEQGGLLPSAGDDGTGDATTGAGSETTAAGGGAGNEPRASGGGAGADPAETGPIRLGTILPLQGGERDFGEPVLRTTQAYIDEVNLRGGIGGRPIELIAYNACLLCQAEALTAARRLVEQDDVFAFVNTYLMVIPFQSVLPYLVDKGVPVIQGGSFDQTSDALSPVNFATAPPGLFFGRLIPEIVRRHTDSRQVALAFLDVPSATNGLPVLRREFARLGIEIVAEEKIPAAEDAVTNMDSAVARMRVAGATSVVALDPAVLIFGRLASRRQGFDVPWVGPAAWSQLVQDGCGRTCDDLVITETAGLSYIDRDSPQMRQYLDVMANRYPGGELTGLTLAAWVGMQLTTHVLARSGTDRTAFLATMESIRNLDLGTTSPLTFTPDRHLGGTRTTLLKLKDAQYVRFTEPVDYGTAPPP